MSQSKFIILNKDGGHEYDLFVCDHEDGEAFVLHYAKCAPWSDHVQGTVAMSIIDDGNDLRLDSKYKKLDYSQAQYMAVLLKAMQVIYPNRHENLLMVEESNLIQL